MRGAPPIVLTPEERVLLEQWSRGRSTPQRLVLRAKIVLRAAEPRTNKEIVQELGTNPITVGRWRRRFALLRVEGIRRDAPRPGRKPRLSAALVKKIVETTLHTKPPGESQWSSRRLADHLGISHSTVQRVWRAHRLQPHRTRSFKLSRDPRFEEKLVDIVGLYMNPPEKALVLCVDEKPHTQALERTQRILPLGPGLPEGIPHDYKRNGRIDLFAALNILDGTVVTEFHKRHRHQEFLSFLRTLDETTPAELEVHAVLDNLSAHMTEEVDRWLHRHPRFHFHFTPTGSSWVNMVESWLSNLTKSRLKRGSFRNVPELIRAIREFTANYNGRAGPFVWTKDAQEILRKVRKIQRLLVPAH